MKPHEVMLVLGSEATEVQEGLRPGVTLSLRAHQVLWLVLRPLPQCWGSRALRVKTEEVFALCSQWSC